VPEIAEERIVLVPIVNNQSLPVAKGIHLMKHESGAQKKHGKYGRHHVQPAFFKH
jgi:hypothetical protein